MGASFVVGSIVKVSKVPASVLAAGYRHLRHVSQFEGAGSKGIAPPAEGVGEIQNPHWSHTANLSSAAFTGDWMEQRIRTERNNDSSNFFIRSVYQK